MWFRVFGTDETAPQPAAILEHLHELGLTVEGHFKGDELGWFAGDFVLSGETAPLHLDRFLAEEEDIRDQLNAWAAWLETSPKAPQLRPLMQMMISVQQLFTLECPRDRVEQPQTQRLCLCLCRYLARLTKGVYQVDSQGFFSPDGTLLVKENI